MIACGDDILLISTDLMDCDITLILPAYNEVARIAGTISEAVRYFEDRNIAYEIIVSADGNDGTREKARKMAASNPAIRVIGEEVRRGKGRGIREAVAIASGKVVGFADADNKVPVDEFDKVGVVLRQGAAGVIGSRALGTSRVERHQPLYRQLGGQAFRVMMRALVGLRHVSDTQCGFKFFRREVAKQLFSLQKIDGYMYDVEILIIASKIGYEICEVPIRWRDDADSRYNLLSGSIRNVIDILKIRVSTIGLRQQKVAFDPLALAESRLAIEGERVGEGAA